MQPQKLSPTLSAVTMRYSATSHWRSLRTQDGIK